MPDDSTSEIEPEDPVEQFVNEPDTEAEPLSPSEAVYQRDGDGDLVPETVEIDTRDGPKLIKIRPITKGDTVDFRDRFGGQDTLEIEETDTLLNEYVTEPEIDWSDPDIKPEVYAGAVDAVVTMALGQQPTNQFHADVRDELAKRADEGN